MTATSQGRSAERSGPYRFNGAPYLPGNDRHWSLSKEGLDRLVELDRLAILGNSLRVRHYLDDFPVEIIKNVWTDTGRSGFGPPQRYVVQTNVKAVERCILMATEPGDLVVDPTCGSGTTAFVCEKHGRRWITMDTSRVAAAIARENLLTSVFDYYRLRDSEAGVDGGFVYQTVRRIQPNQLSEGREPEEVPLRNMPVVEPQKRRVSGPFTVEALSRYSVNPSEEESLAPSRVDHVANHVAVLLDALRTQGVPRPGHKPSRIESLTPMASSEALQAEGILELGSRKARFAVSLGPRFGAITMSQVSDALRSAVGFDLVVFAGFAASPDAQEKLGAGKLGSIEVALLLANPDLLVGDLLRNTASSQTFRLYASPDILVVDGDNGVQVTVDGVDSYDAATGEVVSYGRTGVQAWFLDGDFDGNVFRASRKPSFPSPKPGRSCSKPSTGPSTPNSSRHFMVGRPAVRARRT